MTDPLPWLDWSCMVGLVLYSIKCSHSLVTIREVQDISYSHSLLNYILGNALVNMSAIWSLVEICSIVIVLFATCDLKWCNLNERCLVLGLVLCLVAILMQLMLSWEVLQVILGVILCMWNPCCSNSTSKWMIPITSRSADDNAIYSASVVLNAIRGCNLLFHISGHPA